MTKFLKTSALVLALQPLATLAAPMTLQSTWSCGSSSSCAFTGTGTLTFSFDDATTGTVDSGGLAPMATYLDAITAATMVFDNASLTLDTSGQSRIVVRQGRTAGNGYDASVSFYLLDSSNKQHKFTASFEDYSQTNGGVELFWLAGLDDDEANPAILVPDGASSTPPAGLAYWLLQRSPLTEVPVPATAWLFGSAMLGLAGMAKRKKV